MRGTRPKVYVAGPYTKPDQCINTNAAIKVAENLWGMGFTPFVPHLTHLWHTVSPHPYEFWMEYDDEWIYACDAVYRIVGDSNGADREVVKARDRGIPVFYTYLDLITFLRKWNKEQENV